MEMKSILEKLKNKKIIYILPLTVILLYFDFYFNAFNVVKKKWFNNYQMDSESFIVGRLVKSHRDGIFSSSGLVGLASPDEKPVTYDDFPFDFQYQAYLNNLPFGAYTTYDSMTGGQGILFSMLDKITLLPQTGKLHFFRMLTAFFSALILSLILLWFYLEFGYTVYFTVFVSVFFSQWLVVFSRNLWWSMGSFFLPLVFVIYYLKWNRDPAKIKPYIFGFVVFDGVFIKCLLNGYEYMTAVLVMLTVPVVYYCISNKMKIREMAKLFLISAAGSLIAVLLTMVILCSQISAVKGGFRKGIDHIIYSFQKRTYADPSKFSDNDAKSLEAGTAGVIATYIMGSYLDLNNYLKSSSIFVSYYIFNARYIYLIILFVLLSFLLYFKNDPNGISDERKRALIVSTWFSMLAPLSWFVIFKAHSYKHIHMDYIVWQMPFTIYGFAVAGAVLKNGLGRLFKKKQQARA